MYAAGDRVTYQSRYFNESRVVKQYIHFNVNNVLKMYCVDGNGRTIRESLVFSHMFKEYDIAKAVSLQGKIVGQVLVWSKE